MIRIAALLCGCSLALVACSGGARAAIVPNAAPVAVCLDARDADTPSWRRICPDRIATRASVSRRVGATGLRRSAELASWDLRRPGSEREAPRLDDILRMDMSAMRPPADPALPYAPLGALLRGSLD